MHKASLLAVAATLIAAGCSAAPTPTPTPTPTPSASVPSPNPPPAPTADISQRVVVGNPWSSQAAKVHSVAESALRIIDRTPKGGTITLSMFNLTYPGAADHLIRAHRRGVDVRVLLNFEGANSKQARILRAALGSSAQRRSYVKVRGGGLRMHSKFLLASANGKRRYVVWISSGNITTANGSTQANEALITTGDRPLYRFLGEQFRLMRKGVKDPRRLARSASTLTGQVQTFPLPQGGPAHDPVLQLLDQVACVHGEQRTTIRLAHLFLTVEREYVADRLRDLREQGCVLHIAGHMRGWNEQARGTLEKPGTGRVDVRSVEGAALHTKITTLDGWSTSGERLLVAMIGTHNLTGRALSRTPEGVNDEVALTIHDPATVRTYSRWVDWVIRKHTTRDRVR